MLGYIATGACRMEYLRRELDDPEAAPCGRCDNCTGRPWPAEVSEAGTAAARDRLLRPGVEITPRRMWPTGMAGLGIDASGKIGPELSAEPGRALGRLTDLGWGPRLRGLLADEGGDAVPDDLIAAVVKVLAAWDWEQRPAGVVTLPSRTRPQLVESLAGGSRRSARFRTSAGSPTPVPRPWPAAASTTAPSGWPRSGASSPCPDALGGEIAGLGGPVLLVDDRVETGWTMTVAAKLLRETGAVAVLPLVLAANS